MKKFCIICMIFSLLPLLFGCGTTPERPDTPKKDKDKLSIVATIFPPYDFARQIAKENANLTMLLKPGSESHSYEPTPKDIMQIEQCDVFIYVGGESDEWVNNILDSINTKNMTIISLLDCVDTLEEIEHEDHDGHEEHVEYDEHVWTSPKNAMRITKVIAEKLRKADPKNAQTYKGNEAAYLNQLDELDHTFTTIVQNGSRNIMVFGDRFPFTYFVKDYNLTYLAAFPGCSSETEPSAATMANLIKKVREEKIPVVFHLELSNQKVVDTLCESTEAKKMLFHSCHIVTKDELESGATYLSLMQTNAENLKHALA